MYKLDEQEKIIVRELIKDPRISDNQISIKTNVPLKTVNRKRKILEEKNYVSYHCYLNNNSDGTGNWRGKCMYIIIFKDGITRKQAFEKLMDNHKSIKLTKHLLFSFLGEYEGNIALICILESKNPEDIIEIFNAEMVPEIEHHFGVGGIKKTITLPILNNIRFLKNYILEKNMDKGIIKEDWPNEHIFVDE